MTDHQKEAAKEKLASNARAARERAGLSQSELADRAGVTQATVSGIETGRHLPRLSSVLKLAHALDVESGVLFAGVEWTSPARPRAR